MRFTLIMLLALLLAPTTLLASEKVAILPVSYTLSQGGAPKDLPQKVLDKVVEGAREAEFEVADQGVVTKAIGEEACSDRECLIQLAKNVDATEAAFVSIEDDTIDNAEFSISIVFARRDPVEEHFSGGVYDLLDKAQHLMAVTLLKPAETPEPEPAAEQKDVEQEEIQQQPDTEEEKTRLGPVPFYVSLGTTAALAITWGILEGMTYRAKGSLENGEWDSEAEWKEDIDSAKRLQLVDRIFFATMLAGVATTTVLYFFTDFDKKEQPAGTAFAPAILPDGGALTITRTF